MDAARLSRCGESRIGFIGNKNNEPQWKTETEKKKGWSL